MPHSSNYGLSGDLVFDVLDRLNPIQPEVENGEFVLEGETIPIDAVDGRAGFNDIIVYGTTITEVDSEDGTPIVRNPILYTGKAAFYDDQKISRSAGAGGETRSLTGPVKMKKLRIMWLWRDTLPSELTINVVTETESYVMYRTTDVWYNGYRAEVLAERAQ